MKRNRAKSTYYYAGGQRISLRPANGVVAVDAQRLPDAEQQASLEKRLGTIGQKLNSGLYLVKDAKAVVGLHKSPMPNLYQPVFQTHDALVIPLPEIRIEESRPAQLKRIRLWIEQLGDQAKLVRKGEGRFELRINSGNGEDAIELANKLHEEIEPQLAQTRFVRVVGSPSVRLAPVTKANSGKAKIRKCGA